jgi:CBS domain-containing protein
LEETMRARQIMTKKVRTVGPDTPVRQIAKLMVKARVSAMPVVDAKNRVLGIVSEGDLLRRRETGTDRRYSWWLDLISDPNVRAADYAKSHGLAARDVMSRSVVSVTTDTDISEIADVLEKWSIKRVPVLAGGKLAGIVSRGDLVRALAKSQAKKRRRQSDTAIREALRRAMKRTSWGGDALVNYTVNKGVVELYGLAASSAARDGLRVLAENIDGVRRVKDDLQVRPALIYGAS